MFFDPAALLPPANPANPANPAAQAVITNTITAPAISRLAGLAAPAAANDEANRHHSWRIVTADGERFSSMFDPPLSLSEVQARYPDALVEREPDPAPAPSLSPSALEIVYRYLRHIGETDLQAGQEFIDACTRDPAQLRGLYEDVVKMGLADWPDAETEQATDTGIEATAKAVCSRCTHWTPDRINPAGGIGRCAIVAPASKRIGALWPGDGVIRCNQFEESHP
jgi:hypothetical protein